MLNNGDIYNHPAIQNHSKACIFACIKKYKQFPGRYNKS